MTRIADPRRGLVRGLGLAAAAALMLTVAPEKAAEATSLITPGASATAKGASDGLTTEVQHRGGHGGGGFHGGGGGFRGGGGGFHGGGGFRGGGFHGGGFHGGGMRVGGFHGGGFHGGGFRGGHVFHGGGFHHGGYRFARHHHHRHFYGGYYPSYYPYYYHHRRCRVVWTYYGPRRICRYRHWHHRYYW